jgi:hypothetical protein
MRKAKLTGAVCSLMLGILLLLSLPQTAVAQNVVTGSFTVPLTISNLSVSDIGNGNATVTWDTNGDATSQVFYDIVPHEYIGDYPNFSALDATLTPHHSVQLTELLPGNTYYSRAYSKAGDGIASLSAISQEEHIVIPGTGPKPLKYFGINDLFIYWSPHTLRWQGNDSFSIYGRLQLPQGYTAADLQRQATVTITIAGQSGSETVVFTGRASGWPQNVMWLYKETKHSSPGESMNITTMTMWWAPLGIKWSNWAGFYIGGVLQLPVDIAVNTKSPNVKVTIEIPITTAAGGGTVKGEQTMTCKVYKTINLWRYSSFPKPPAFPYDTTGNAYEAALTQVSIDHYSVSNISSPQAAGRTFSVTIQAQDEDNNNIDSGSEAVNITFGKADAGATPLSTSTTHGAATVSMTMAKVQTSQTITFTGGTSGKSGTSNSFNVNAAIPAAPTLKSPASNSTISNRTPKLEWNTSTGATSYSLQVSTKSNFASLVINQTGIANSYYDVPSGKLSGNTTYYWRENASNAVGTSDWPN